MAADMPSGLGVKQLLVDITELVRRDAKAVFSGSCAVSSRAY